jgi:hypothetical protein
VLSFANQVSNHPVVLANLEIFRSGSDQFGPSQAASNEEWQNRPITFATESGTMREFAVDLVFEQAYSGCPPWVA